MYSQQNDSQAYEILFQISNLSSVAGSDGDYDDHSDGQWQIGASVSLLLALSMVDGWVLGGFFCKLQALPFDTLVLFLH